MPERYSVGWRRASRRHTFTTWFHFIHFSDYFGTITRKYSLYLHSTFICEYMSWYFFVQLFNILSVISFSSTANYGPQRPNKDRAFSYQLTAEKNEYESESKNRSISIIPLIPVMEKFYLYINLIDPYLCNTFLSWSYSLYFIFSFS